MQKILTTIIAIFICSYSFSQDKEVCITIDDLPVVAYTSKVSEEEIVNQFISFYQENNIPAIGFVNEHKLVKGDAILNDKRRGYLENWLQAGLELGNHSYSHPNYHQVGYQSFTADILEGEKISKSLTKKYGQSFQFFRHPYLKLGKTKAQADSLSSFLATQGYLDTPVTIDNDDYIFAKAYELALVGGNEPRKNEIAKAYLKHTAQKIEYYEKLSEALFKRQTSQIFLIHINKLNADCLNELQDLFVEKGYTFISLSTALEDSAYQTEIERYGDWGISWLERWALSNQEARTLLRESPKLPSIIQKEDSQENKALTYLGQKPPAETPKIFAPNIISKSDRYEFGCTFSKDGKEMFFGVDNNGLMEIYHTYLENGVWTKSKKLFKSSPFGHNDPMLSPDENRLFFISNRPNSDAKSKKDIDIWFSERAKNGWSEPKNIGAPINTPRDEYFVSFTDNGKMYFSSKDSAENTPQYAFDIYSSGLKNGKYTKPKKLPSTINTARYEADVFVAPDESYLIFCTIRRDGFGRGDLYISFKDENGNWLEAVNMGKTINSKGHELCPFVSKDGKYFFYTSNEDIYWVDAKILEKYIKQK